MSKAKLISICGVSSAVCVGCLALASFVKWTALICAVLATVACALPTLLSARYWWYSVLSLIVSGALGVFIGLANVVYVAPIVAFCMPFGIVKAYGESIKVTANVGEPTVLEDPFGGEDRQTVAVNVESKLCLPRAVKWILYYVLLEVGLGLTVLFAYLFTKPVFEALLQNNVLYWILGGAQLVVIPYDLLTRGCFVATVKIMSRARIV